jgi:hypothetical protein
MLAQSFAMQQLLGGGKNHGGGLAELAGQLLSGGSGHSQGGSSSGSGASGLVGALAGSLLGGTKPNQHQDYSSSQSSQGGSLMSSLGGMFNSGHQSSSVR